MLSLAPARWFIVVAGLLLVSGCHRATVVDSWPLVTKLSAYRSARILVVTPGLDADDASDFAEALEKKLTHARIFRSVAHENQPSELLIRVTLLDKKEDSGVELDFAVEMFDQRRRQLVGRFDVTADSKEFAYSGGGGIHLDLDSKTTRALEKAENAIISHLEQLARGD